MLCHPSGAGGHPTSDSPIPSPSTGSRWTQGLARSMDPIEPELQTPRHERIPAPGGVIAYLCACIDERFIDAFLQAFRHAAGTTQVYFETEPGGAPAFGAAPASAQLVYGQKGCRLMGWGAHGSGCAGFPRLSDEDLRRRLYATAAERAHDFPEAVHYVLFAVMDGAEVDIEVSRVSSAGTPR